MTNPAINHSRILRLTPTEAAAVRAKCQRVLDDPAWQDLVVAEAVKRGKSRADTVLEAQNIIAAINHHFN